MTTFEILQQLFLQASELPAGRRGAFVDEKCAGDLELKAELLRLLAFDEASQELPEQWGGHAVEPLSAGRMLDGHELLGLLGQGSAGLVYRARQPFTGREVALKLLRTTHPESLLRLRREARHLAFLDHPGVVRVLHASALEVGGSTYFYLTMELLQGDPISTFVDRDELDMEARLALFAVLLDAVAYTHAHGVVHRDLKPGNVLVVPGGQPKVLDFGIAHNARQEPGIDSALRSAGTLEYMAPEQLDGHAGSDAPAVDVYSLGVLAHRVLAGRVPLELATLSWKDATAALRGQRPPSIATLAPALPPAFAAAVDAALDKDPARRPTVRDLERAARAGATSSQRAGVTPDLAEMFHRLFESDEVGLPEVEAAAKLVPVLSAGRPFVEMFLRRTFGGAFHGFGQLPRALEEFKRASASAEELFGLAHPETFICLGWEAIVLRELGRLEEAEEVSLRLLDLRRRHLGPEHPDTAMSLSQLGLIWKARGRLAESLRVQREAYDILRGVKGEDDHETLIVRANLGDLLRERGELEESVECLEGSIVGLRRLGGQDHPETLKLLNNLAVAYSELERYEESLALLEEVLTVQRRRFQDGHPGLLTVQHNMARTNILTGRFAEAATLARAALEAIEGAELPAIVGALSKVLGEALSELGRPVEARPHLERAYAWVEGALPATDPRTIEIRGALAYCRGQIGEVEEARSELETCLALLSGGVGTKSTIRRTQRRLSALTHLDAP